MTSNRFLAFLAGLLLLLATAHATPVDVGYRSPPDAIVELVDMAPPIEAFPAPGGDYLAMLSRPPLPLLVELAAPEARLAGLRFNPDNLAPSQPRYFSGIELIRVNGDELNVSGLPEPLRMLDLAWSPNGEHLAWLQLENDAVVLWRLDMDLASGQARAKRWGDRPVHAAWGRFGQGDMAWLPDSSAVIHRSVPAGRGEAPLRDLMPCGPVVTETRGRAAPTRTFQDLLSDSHDERLFEHHFQTEIVRVDLSGHTRVLEGPGVFTSFSPSPDGQYLLLTRLVRPWSYAVPVFRFGHEITVIGADGSEVFRLTRNPLADGLPIAFDAVIDGPRSAAWRADVDATLIWVEAADGGDPATEADVRDRLLQLAAPFDTAAQPLLESPFRIVWTLAGDGDTALVWQRWWDSRVERVSRLAPDHADFTPEIIWERNWEDRYGDPGVPMTRRDERGQTVLALDNGAVLLSGQGGSPEGDRPFVDRRDLASGETERLWRSASPHFERSLALLDIESRRILTQRESQHEPPDYFIRDLAAGDVRRLTQTEHPLPALREIQRELITFDRDDGVTLSATLLLPAGYDAERDGPLPTVIWAYPREFLSADAAGQLADSPYRFNRLSYWNAEFLVTRGFAVLNNVTMPVIGGDGLEPNDRFVEEITLNAEAAIAAGTERGVTDPERVAVGGHSYGAFMTASLLAHTDLFRTGIARSGAYNRSLTPFGFQREQRTLWDDTDLYVRVSPFFHAHRISAPVLIIHGAEDNNSGTFPMQSERLYQAIRGLGGTARLVMLPLESHGYRARESVLHMLYETINWLEEHLGPETSSEKIPWPPT
ncbi:MAG: S9 family peptidase [Wenzhouxiangella sp.]|nr:S9 family peptidase [Wenzhouxiangella sp.]